ncbi:MAG: amidase family protein, partial [Desulfatiglandales bacterium]
RYVEDAWAFLKATAGFHPLDPHSGLAELNLEDGPDGPKERLRILYSRDLGRFPVEKRVVERVEDVVRKLEGFGHRVYELAQDLPDLERAWWTYMAMDLAFQLGRELEEKRAQLNRAMVKSIEEVLGLRIGDLEDVREARAQFYLRIQGLFEMADILITPTTPTAAFAAEGPPPESIEGKAVRLLDVVAFTYPFNLTGHPAMNIRAGLTEEGLPVGLQLVAPLMREDLLVRLGFELQEGLGLHTRWPN